MSVNRIQVKGNGRYEEAVASGILKPGHLIKLDSDGKVLVHSTPGGAAMKAFALENALLGKTIDDAYAVGDIVPYAIFMPGDVVQARVPAGAAAIVIGDQLISDGTGCLKKNSTPGSVLYANTAASTALTNTVSTEQDFDLTYSIPADTLKVGDVLTIKGHAVVSAQASTDTLTLKLYLGSVALLTSAAVDSAVGDVVHFSATVVIRTIGASGTYVAAGVIGNGVPGTATMRPGFVASTAYDTTAAKTVKVSATWSATSSANTVALQSLVVERTKTSPTTVIAMAEAAKDNSAAIVEGFCTARVL